MARSLKVILGASALVNFLLLIGIYHYTSRVPEDGSSQTRSKVDVESSDKDTLKMRPITFVGGVPRSGTTLLRVMLDAHPDIRCGEETRVIPRIVSMRSKWMKSEKEHKRLLEAGLTDENLDDATRAFISQVIAVNGPMAPYLCNKDPLVLNYMPDIVRLYPKAKFILMIRDGRAVAYSIIDRNVTITGVDSKSYVSAALFWNKVIQKMTTDCRYLGRHRCLQVHYEELAGGSTLHTRVRSARAMRAKRLIGLESPQTKAGVARRRSSSSKPKRVPGGLPQPLWQDMGRAAAWRTGQSA